MSGQTRRSVLQRSGAILAGLGTVGAGTVTAEPTKLDGSDARTDTPDRVRYQTSGVTTTASWPVEFSFTDVPPGYLVAGDSPAIAEGTYYDFELRYEPEHTVHLGFVDEALDTFYYYDVSGDGLYRLEAPASIPEDSAYVGIRNPSDASRDISGDLSVSN